MKELLKNSQLPEHLRQQILTFERQLKQIETITTICGALIGVFFTYGILFLSDRFWDTPVWLRVVLTLMGSCGFGWFSFRWMKHWLLKRRDARKLARMIQRQFPGMGDRLLGVVELADGTSLPEHASPELRQAAIEQVSRETEKYDFSDAILKNRSRLFGSAFVVLLLLTGVPMMMFPQAGCNALQRWMNPVGGPERFTFVNIAGVPDELVVAHGEGFEMVCKVTEDSKWKPENARCQIKGQPEIRAVVSADVVQFDIPGQIEEKTLEIRIGDDRKHVRIIPVHRPEMTRMLAVIRQPDYLARPVETNRVENRSVSVVEGSEIQLKGKVSRGLERAVMISAEERTLPVDGASFSTGAFFGSETNRLKFSWRDTFGLDAPEVYRLHIDTVEDLAPAVELSGVSRAIAILEDESVPFDLAAEDDYGVKRLWMDWSVTRSGTNEVGRLDHDPVSVDGSPRLTTLTNRFEFSPLSLHIPEQSTVMVKAYATDFLPGRLPVESASYRVYVLNRAQHAKIIQQQMEALQAGLDELVQDEEELMEKNMELLAQEAAELAHERSREQLQDNEARERGHEKRLENMADQMDKLLKEALKNKDVPAESIRKWAEMSDAMKSAAAEEMTQSAQALQQAAAQPGERKEQTESAVDLERKALEKLRKLESDMNDTMEDFIAESFMNRLKEVARLEADVAESFQAMLPRVVGMRAEDLPEELFAELSGLVDLQQRSRKQAGYIEDDLQGFHQRTGVEVYSTVHEEMVEKEMKPRLEALREMIRENVGSRSIDAARKWEVQFLAWAELLKEESPLCANGSGGQGEAAEVDMETLIALMRARQKEQNIRRETRSLNEAQAENKRYHLDATRLARMQFELASELQPVETRARDMAVRRMIGKIGGEMMNVGVQLRQPDTGQKTISIETEIIELLSKAMEGTGAASASASPSMASLMSAQGAGGGNAGQGASSITAESDSGTAAGSDDAERSVEKTSGMNPGEFPVEYRSVLETYFNRLDGIL